jgi:hypothetical protein
MLFLWGADVTREETSRDRSSRPRAVLTRRLLAYGFLALFTYLSLVVLFLIRDDYRPDSIDAGNSLDRVFAFDHNVRQVVDNPEFSKLERSASEDYSTALKTALDTYVQPDNTEAAFQAFHDAIDRVKAKSSSIGRLVFTHPSTMKVDKAYYVTVRITKDRDVNLTEELDVEGKLEKRRIKVAGIMAASLSGSEDVFYLKPLSREEQALEDDEYTEWKWLIVPRVSGLHRLRLTIAKRVDTTEGPAFKEERVLDEQFPVTITAIERVKKFAVQHFEFLAGAIFLPPLIVIGRALTRASKKRIRTLIGADGSRADVSIGKEQTDKTKDEPSSKAVEGG